MHPIIYDVAVSIDGYISGPGGDVSGFAFEGDVVDDYVERLAGYSCALMGRVSYEFGYAYGLRAGQNPYPHMRSIVVSSTVRLPQNSDVEVWNGLDLERVRDLKTNATGPIYLCGGGVLATGLNALGMIDVIRLKRAPILLGDGTPLLNGSTLANLRLKQVKTHKDGYVFQEFSVR